jgi:hypothetical protein
MAEFAAEDKIPYTVYDIVVNVLRDTRVVFFIFLLLPLVRNYIPAVKHKIRNPAKPLVKPHHHFLVQIQNISYLLMYILYLGFFNLAIG